MRGILTMLAMSVSLALTSTSAQAHTPPDRKVDYALELQASKHAIQLATAPAMEVSMECRQALDVQLDQLVLVATSTPATASTSAVAVLPTKITVATDVVAPPNAGGVGVSSQRRTRQRSTQDERPVPTLLHPDPGRN